MKVRLICLALWLALVAFALTRPAHAETITVCAKMELPGKDHTLNPNDPLPKQRQEVVRVCELLEVQGQRDRFDPVTDYRRDPRAWA